MLRRLIFSLMTRTPPDAPLISLRCHALPAAAAKNGEGHRTTGAADAMLTLLMLMLMPLRFADTPC